MVLAAATKSSHWLVVAIAGYAAATAQTMAYNMDLIKPSPFALYVKTPHQMRRIRELEELLGWPLDSFAARDVLFNGAHEQKHIAVARHLRGGARGGGRSKLGLDAATRDPTLGHRLDDIRGHVQLPHIRPHLSCAPSGQVPPTNRLHNNHGEVLVQVLPLSSNL